MSEARLSGKTTSHIVNVQEADGNKKNIRQLCNSYIPKLASRMSEDFMSAEKSF